MSDIESNHARVVVWHDDPRLPAPTTRAGRLFRIEVLHALDENNPERKIDDILIEGSPSDVIKLLEALGVNRMEFPTAKRIRLVGNLIAETVPFDAEKARARLVSDPEPLNCFISHITKDEILERLHLWQTERADE